MSNEKLNLYTKLAKARVELQNKNLSKTGENKYAGFKYFELKDFLPSVNEIFNELGLLANFSLFDGMAELKITDVENIESSITFSSPTKDAGMKGMSDIQALGSQHTYLKRYLYLNALEIVDNDSINPIIGDPEIKKDRANEEKRYTELRTKLTSLKVDFREDETTVNYILNAAKIKHQDNQKLTDNEIKRLNHVYEAIIANKEKEKKEEKSSSLDDLQ